MKTSVRFKTVNRNMNSTFVFLFVLLALYNPTNAQNTNVAPSASPLQATDKGIKAEMAELDRAKKQNAQEMAAFEEVIRKLAENKKLGKNAVALPDTSCVATIPVVFHVFHPNGSAGVPLSQVAYAVRDLNITFGGKDVDYTTVNAAFSGVKSYTKIRFALANIDPQGNPTNGIVYYKDKQSGFGNGTGYDNQIANVAWDNYKYFNIYVMNDLYANNVTNNSGVCWYPNTGMSNAGTARMVYNYSYLGQGGASFNNLEFNQTLTHECGHYMNLLHTFEGNSCSSTGDLCNDTPPTDVTGAGCNAVQCSALINGENYMDYNATCYKNFTMDQNTRMEAALTHPSRVSLWQYSNLVATGVLSASSTNSCVTASKFFSYSKSQLLESVVNDGSIEMPPVIIKACAGAQFVNANQTLVAGTDYTVGNLPSGLSFSIVTSGDAKTATLTVIGQAGAHGSANTLSNINFAFTNAAVVGGNVSSITNYSNTFKIKFYDPWGLTCVSPAGISANTTTTWSRFETAGPVPRYYGLWYNASSYYLENYGRALITAGANSDNVVFLPTGTVIGPASVWRAGGSQGLLYSPSYTALNGLTGFVGFRMQIGNDYYYGYMNIQVSSTGVSLIEYVYNNKPNEPIIAGTNCLNVGLQKADAAVKPMVFPNPSSGKVYVNQISANYFGGTCSVYSIEGRLLKSEKIGTTMLDMNLDTFEPGLYILKISTSRNDGQSFETKIIKN